MSGYGYRQTTTNCSEAMIVVSLQAVLGCIIQAFMVGMVFSKLSRPRNRSKTIIFSNQATITMRNRRLCLIIRIGDLREDNFILDTQVSNCQHGGGNQSAILFLFFSDFPQDSQATDKF